LKKPNWGVILERSILTEVVVFYSFFPDLNIYRRLGAIFSKNGEIEMIFTKTIKNGLVAYAIA